MNAKGKEVDKITMALVLHASRVLARVRAREEKEGTCISVASIGTRVRG